MKNYNLKLTFKSVTLAQKFVKEFLTFADKKKKLVLGEEGNVQYTHCFENVVIATTSELPIFFTDAFFLNAKKKGETFKYDLKVA